MSTLVKDWHLSVYTEYVMSLPKEELCVCGCERQCHSHYFGIVGVGVCSNNDHLCKQFRPAKIDVSSLTTYQLNRIVAILKENNEH